MSGLKRISAIIEELMAPIDEQAYIGRAIVEHKRLERKRRRAAVRTPKEPAKKKPTSVRVVRAKDKRAGK